ncbi:MAG: hypothetical protein HGGPFJEG_01199 [Ignavibacteria bacterium]|nr:hypothetical protein [Ignavibacteria bacterium]
MENSKLVRLLKSLNQYEIRQFRDFLCSPVFNKKKILIRLFDELKKYYPDFKSDKLSDEKLYASVYPDKKYDYFKLKNSISDLFILGKEYLEFSGFRKDEDAKERYLLKELRFRSLLNIFQQVHKSALQRNEKKLEKDEQYLQHKLSLTVEELNYLTPQMPNMHLQYQQKMLDLFLEYSLIKIFKVYNVMMHEEKQNNFKYDKYLFDELMTFTDKSKFDNPTLRVYHQIISLESNRNDENFYKLKGIGEKYKNSLSVYDTYMVFLHLNGYCANEFNVNSRTDLATIHFEIIKDKNETDYTTLGSLLYPDFINEIKIALRADEIKWAEDYIEKNKSRLSSEKENTIYFCNAVLNLKKGNPEKALELLSKTNFPNFIIKVQVKLLQLQILYELEYFEQVFSSIDNFRHYIKRESTIKEDFKETFYEFVNILNALIKLKTLNSENGKDYELNKINSDIENMRSNQFGLKLWLKDMVKSDYKF